MIKRIVFNFLFLSVFLVSCSSSDDGTNIEPNPSKETPLYVTEKVDSGTNLGLNSISFLNNDLGFVAGGDVIPSPKAIVLKTIDGGLSWQTVFEEEGFYINSIYVKSALEVYAVTNNGIILKSVDAGTSWEKNQNFKGSTYFMNDISFKDNENGVIVGSTSANGFILTTDNNAVWQDVSKENEGIEPTEEILNLMIENPFSSIVHYKNTITIAGGTWSDGKISLCHNSSEFTPWDVVTKLPESLKFTDVAIAEKNIWVTGSNGQSNAATELGVLYYSANGVDWSKIEYGANNKLEAIDFNKETVVAVGRNKSNNLTDPEFAVLSTDKGNSWQRVKHDFVTASWTDVVSISDHKMLLIGNKGLILKLELK